LQPADMLTKVRHRKTVMGWWSVGKTVVVGVSCHWCSESQFR
jgi:hypothetical protein